MQGFENVDAYAKDIDQASPTWRRLGRSLVLFLLVPKRWKAFIGDVQDAFLQGIDLETVGVVIFGQPTKEIV